MIPTETNRTRWIVLILLFAASFLNYFDRQTLSILKPTIKGEFGLDDSGYSLLVTAFMVPYVIMYALGGRLSDRWGSRTAMALFVGFWSAATMLIGWVRNFAQLGACRFGLGFAEAGAFPAGIRALSVLFPSTQRGFALSVFSAGSAIGSMVAPPVIAYLAVTHGWRSAFVLPGMAGLVWVGAWLLLTKGGGMATLRDGSPSTPWSDMFRRRELWGMILARLVSDPVWYFYLFWIPGYLQERLGLTLTQAGAVGWIPFLVADIAGVGITSFSDLLVRRGCNRISSRIRIIMVVAVFAPIALVAPNTASVPLFLFIAAVLGAVCTSTMWSSAALMSEAFPKEAVASMMGVAGAFGALGGLLFNSQIGRVVDTFGYKPVFVLAACLHPIAAVITFLIFRPKTESAQQ